MSQIITDDFNRSNSTGLGANWTNSAGGGFNVASNQASSSGTGTAQQSVFTGASWTGGNDQYAEATIITKLSPKDGSILVRGNTATESGYFLEINDNDAAVGLGVSMRCGMYKVVASAFTLLGSTASFTVSSGDVLRVEAQGTSITAKVNGVTKFGPTTDAGIASGNPGINAGNSAGVGGIIFDNFAAGDFVVSNVASSIGWRNQQNPRLNGTRTLNRFQRTQLWETAAQAATTPGPLSGASSLAFSSTGTLTGVGSLSGNSELTVQSSATPSAKGALSGQSQFTVQSRAPAAAKGSLAGASSVTVQSNGTPSAKGSLAGASSLALQSSGTPSGKGALAGSSSVTLNSGGTLTSQAVGSMIGRSVMTVSARGTLAGTGRLIGQSTATFTTRGTPSGKGDLVGRSEFTLGSVAFLRGLLNLSGRSQFNLLSRGTLFGLPPADASIRTEFPLTTVFLNRELRTEIESDLLTTSMRDVALKTEVIK